jgi:hypothetical protein
MLQLTFPLMTKKNGSGNVFYGQVWKITFLPSSKSHRLQRSFLNVEAYTQNADTGGPKSFAVGCTLEAGSAYSIDI